MRSNALARRTAPVALSLAFAFFVGGCALQSTLVDLEQEIKTTRETQSEFARRSDFTRLEEELTGMIRSVKNVPLDNAEGRALISVKLNQVEEQLRRLEGRFEEDGHKTTEAIKTLEDQTQQVNVLAARLDLLEKQMAALKTASPTGTPPVAGGQEGENRLSGVSDGALHSVFSLPPFPSSVPPSPDPAMPATPVTPPPAPLPSGGLAPTMSPSLVSPQEAYRLAYNDYLRGNYDLAIMNFKHYVAQYPHSAFLPEALYWIGQSYYNQGIYPDAIQFLKQMEERYPAHELVPNALLKTALAFSALRDMSSARAALEKVIERFPQSEAAMRAKGELAVLNSNP